MFSGAAMRKAIILLILSLLAQVACVAANARERRVALLIGNQSYDPSVGVLKNPHNDIELVADALRQQGFEVMPLVKDARRSVILQNVRQLANLLTVAGPGTIGMLYYSGHGAAERDTSMNYLIPIDARDPGTTTFWDDSLKLDDVLRLLERAQGATKFIIFDACRNELQLPSRDTNKGLLPVSENHGFFLAYASAPGRTASDRGERSGPYAAALAAELRKPGLDHLNLFQNVKEAVISATGGAQQPWESNGLIRRVYLTGQPPAAAPAGSTPAVAAPPADAPQREWSAVSEYVQWDAVRASDDPAALERFLRQYPTGVFAATARQMLDRLRTGPALPAPAQLSTLPAQPGLADPGATADTARRRPPDCDDGERLVNGRCVPVARQKKPSKVRESVLRSAPARVRERSVARAAARPAAAPQSSRMCFNSSTGGRAATMVPCDDPRSVR